MHRNTSWPVNGQSHFAQRCAIDWMRLDVKGRLVHGNPSDVHSYAAYGADIVAAADGVIVETRNDLGDQIPPACPT